MIKNLNKHDLTCSVFSAYDYNDLSMHELLNTFFTKINECVDFSNNTLELADWLVNEGLSKEVVKKLMIWLNDGTLENLINVELFSSLNDKIDSIKKSLTLNILDFNVDREGIQDSTQGFKDALNLLGGDYSKGGSLFIPQGKYKITDTIFIPPNVQLKGDGKTTYFSSANDDIGTTIIFECENIEKPCVSFIGKNNLGQHIYDYSVTGNDLDNGTIKQTTSSSLKNLTLYSKSNHNIGVVFAGCPLSTIEDVSIKGFVGGIMVSANWGSVINRVFTQTLFFGLLTGSNTNNLQVNGSYFDRTGNISSLPSNSKLYGSVNSGDFLKPNVPTGVYARYGYNLKVTNTCIEHWECGIQTGGSGASTNWDTVWLEMNNQPIATQSEIHTFRNFYIYGVKDGNAVVLANGNRILLENFHGTFNKLFKDNYQRYVQVVITNCKDGNKFIQFLDSEKAMNKVYVDEVNGSDYNFGNESMPLNSLYKAFQLVASGGEIILLSDINVTQSCKLTNKNIVIKSDSTVRKITPNKTTDVVRQIEIENSTITFDGVILDTFINASHVGDASYTAFIKPISMYNNVVNFKGCTINTKINYGIFQHDHSKNSSYVRVNFCRTNITGDGAKSKNGYDSGTLHVEEFSQGCNVASSVTTYASASVIIHQY